ncbi:MAG: DUF4142 domain-containing protein [Gemmatimonadota bacterium]
MKRAGKARVLATALVVVIGAACSEAPEEEASAGPAAAEAAPSAQPAVTDAEIAAIVVAANEIDVRYGELARERATDPAVKQFAETMITDHTAVNESAVELVTRLGVTPEESDVSRSLEASAAETRQSLETKSGAEFDQAYIDNEVAYHQTVLDALDGLLIPSATNAELKQTLVGVRPAFEAHLEHAKALQQTVRGS